MVTCRMSKFVTLDVQQHHDFVLDLYLVLMMSDQRENGVGGGEPVANHD